MSFSLFTRRRFGFALTKGSILARPLCEAAVSFFQSQLDALEGLTLGTPQDLYTCSVKVEPSHTLVLDEVPATPAPFHLETCDLLCTHNYLAALAITA